MGIFPPFMKNVLVWHLRVSSVRGIRQLQPFGFGRGGSSESSGASETILIQTWVSIAGSKMSSLCTMENSSITPTRDPILKKSS